jgi:hypothetical protein
MGVSGQRHASAAGYTRGNDPRYPLDRRLPETVWIQRLQGKILSPCRGSNLDRPVVQSVGTILIELPLLINYVVRGHKGEVTSKLPLTSDARIRIPVSQCRIYGGQSDTGTGFSPNSSVFPVNVILTWPSILIYNLGNEQFAHWWQQLRVTFSLLRRDHQQ